MEIEVKSLYGNYNIYFQNNGLKNVGEYLDLNRKVLIVTDDGVPSEYAKTVSASCKTPIIITINQGEASKNFDNYILLLKVLTENRFSRYDCIVAVGGGVVGDLTGFVAATYMRGIDFYNIPTTVLSQVDSSVGGKVAVDFLGFKNIVGTFYPPKCVFIDVSLLNTLPKRQISNGLAEAVKMGLTGDESLFNLFENDDYLNNIEKIIEKSLRYKSYVVQQDEKESGLRKVLNFGHTIGHGIESQQFNNLLHGECVALGMLCMCNKSVKKRLLPVLNRLSLPLTVNCDIDKIFDAILHDKKGKDDCVTAIKVEKIGSFVMEHIPFSDLKEKIKEVLV